ncbi:MAG: PD-(D/E)XK nuclease family protein [Balneolaceae bacterium]|nr:PD-(D/E)XK nuclease family protein [Balneolaceae bacterium]
MTVYNRLLNLYGSGDSLRTPMEDFCTECLAGILSSSQDLLNEFVDEILNIPSNENFKLYTQKRYISDKNQLNIVDLVFESTSTICFLEMKVYASEGVNQLIRYDQILKEQFEKEKENIQLRYCSLYYDRKEDFSKQSNFKQFRWADIASFFQSKINESDLINEFYQFLKEMKMAGNERFNYEDIVGLQRFGEITAKIDEIFQLLQPELEKSFGKTSGGVNASGQIKNHNRLALWCQYVVGDSWSEVLISFNFSGGMHSNGPTLVTQLWISKNNSQYDDIRKAALKDEELSFIEDNANNGGAILFKKSLVYFLEEEDQIGQIKNWFSDSIQKLSDFKKERPDLEWKS